MRTKQIESGRISNALHKEPLVERKIVFCSGISGSGKKKFAEEVADYAKAENKTIKIFDVERILFKISEEIHGLLIPKKKFLDLPSIQRKALRRAMFECLLKEMKDKSDIPIIIVSHATFFWKSKFEAAFDYHFLEEIKPDMYVMVTDTLSKIKSNLNPDGVGIELSDEKLLYWQDVERLVTMGFAISQRKKFYLLPRVRPRTLYKLIFTSMRKIYLSYPMAFAEDEHLKKIKEFREKLENFFIVFDPGDVWDFPETAANKEIERILRDQTVHRDLQLIDQSDAVVAYFPQIIYAKGTDDECKHAVDTGKDVFVIYPSKNISPFLSINATKIFYSEHEFFESLAEKDNPAGRI